jgi:hypothetical protein
MTPPPERLRACTLYLDDSGDTAWPGKSAGTPEHFVLAGLVVPTQLDVTIWSMIEQLLAQSFPESGTRPLSLPHYSEVVARSKKGACGVLGEVGCKRLADQVWTSIRELNPVLMGTVVRKRVLRDRWKERAEDPLQYALRATIARFDIHLEEIGQTGQIILDSRARTEEKRLADAVAIWRLQGTGYSQVTPPHLNRKLSRITNTVLFVRDQHSPGVQLADWIAHCTWGHFEHLHGERYHEVSPLWRTVGNFQEPSVLPKSR